MDSTRTNAEKRKTLREKFATNLGAMALYMFPKSFKAKYGIPWYAPYIWYVLFTYNRIVVKLPRFHAKSTFITFLYVMYCILFKRKRFIVIFSANGMLAMRFLNRIRNYLSSRVVRILFGRVDAKYDVRFDNQDEIRGGNIKMSPQWNTRGLVTGWGQTIVASSITGSKRGMLADDDRPDLILLDDVEDKKNTNTPELRQKLLETLYEEIIPMGTDDEELQIIIVGTICHNGSILLKLEVGTTWYIVPIDRATYPLNKIDELNKNIPERFHFKPHKEYFTQDWLDDGVEYKKGEETPEVAIWQQRYSFETFLRRKIDYRDRGVLASFYQENYNIPKAKEFRIFTEFRYLPYVRFSTKFNQKVLMSDQYTFANGFNVINVETYGGIDLAISEASGADWRVLFPLAIDPYDNRYLFPPYYSKEKPVAFTTAVFRYHLKYKFRSVGFDSQAYQETWAHLARYMMGRYNEDLGMNVPYMNTKKFPRYREKYDTIEAVMDRVWGRTYLVGTPDQFEIFENEMRELRYSDTDDFADACTYANMVARPPELFDFDKIPAIPEDNMERTTFRDIAKMQNQDVGGSVYARLEQEYGF